MTSLATALILVLQAALPNISKDRLMVVTDDIVAVVNEESANGSLKSTISREDAVAALTAAVTHESGYREDVEKCAVNGDGGKSVGLGQVMIGQNWEGHTRKQICENRKLQVRLALHVIDRCWLRTPRGDAAFRCYTSGDAAKDSPVARNEFRSYRKLRHTIDVHLASHKKIDKEKPRSTENSKEVIVAKNP